MASVPPKQNLSKWQHFLQRRRMFRNWYKVVFPFNRLFNHQTKLVLRNGYEVWVRSVFSGDLTTVEGVLHQDEYGEALKGLPPDAVIYDLGANIGTFSIAAKKACPHARIVAYEPEAQNFVLLQKNAPFAELHQEAVAGVSGHISFDASSHPYAHRISKEGTTTLVARALGDVLADAHIHLAKIDIEGAEHDALELADPALFARVGRIIMETHHLGTWGKEKLEALGYTARWCYRLLWMGQTQTQWYTAREFSLCVLSSR